MNWLLTLVFFFAHVAPFPQIYWPSLVPQQPLPNIIVTSKTCVANGSGLSVSCTWSANPAAGESIFCGLVNINTLSGAAVTDSNNDSYSGAGSPYNFTVPGVSWWIQIFYFTNLPTSISTTTFSIPTSSASANMYCNSATGVKATGALDGSICTGKITSAGSTVSCSSALSTSAADLIVALGGTAGGVSLSLGSGFTLGATTNNQQETEYLVQSASGSVTPSFGVSPSADAGMVGAAFKP
jgi:hypothetical protein